MNGYLKFALLGIGAYVVYRVATAGSLQQVGLQKQALRAPTPIYNPQMGQNAAPQQNANANQVNYTPAIVEGEKLLGSLLGNLINTYGGGSSNDDGYDSSDEFPN